MDKKFLVSFLIAVSFLFLIATVSAATQPATISKVEVSGVNVNDNPVVVVGDNVVVRVDFTALVNASDITVKADLSGDKLDVQAETAPFDIESGQTYSKYLQLAVPFDLQDVLSNNGDLNIKISGSGYKTEADYSVRVQRQPYSADILSVVVPQNTNAGQLFPVDIVLKNLGYDNLNDIYVTASIPALGVKSTSYFGDLVALECDKDSSSVQNYGVNITRKCNENNQDTVSGRIFLQLPWNVQPGTYAVQVVVQNGDTSSTQTVQLVINNAFANGNFIVSGDQLLIVNPTNQVAVYRLVPETTSAVSVSLSDTIVAVPAGTSRTVTVDGKSTVSGTQNYAVDIFASDGSLVGKANFTTTSGTSAASPIVVLTIVLAVIFVVLLVVLIVLIGKKPSKTEEFGESYY